jgi:competence protein ComEA
MRMFKKILAVVALLFYTALALAAVDVNKASEAQLDSVKGIGPGTSKLILEERKKGEFKSWDDFITRVKGVGEMRAKNLSEAGLTVGGKAYQPTAAGANKDDKAARRDTRADEKADAKTEKKEAKAEAKAEKKEAKADAKAKTAQADANASKQEARAEKKQETAASARPAASATKK